MKQVVVAYTLASPTLVASQYTIAGSVASDPVLDGYVSYSIEFSSFPDFAGMLEGHVLSTSFEFLVLTPAQGTIRTQILSQTLSSVTSGTSLVPSPTFELAETPRTMRSTMPPCPTPWKASLILPAQQTIQQP